MKPAVRAQPQQAPPGVSVGSVATAHVVVALHPAIEQRVGRRPDEAAVVWLLARGQHTAGPQHAAHLDQRRDGIGQMLQQLVGVDDLE